jgi:hypothetical protein
MMIKPQHQHKERMKEKIKCSVKLMDFYKYYKKESKNPVDYSKYSEISKELSEGMIDILYNQGELKLPLMGRINIFKRKRKIVYNEDGTINKIGYKVDWKKTKEYWGVKYPGYTKEQLKAIKGKTKIYCESEFRLFFKYDKRSSKYKGKSFLYFIPVRQVCRNLNKFVNENKYIDYKEKYN